MRYRRLMSLLLAALMCLSLLPVSAMAGYIEEGTLSGGVTWSLNKSSGKLTITGAGPIQDFTGEAPWEAFKDKLKTAEIGSGITAIGARAFFACYYLTSVKIPDTVESIGKDAFNSTGLTSVSIPGSVKTIGESAFYQCGSMKTVTFGKGVETLGKMSFMYAGVEEIDLPDSVKTIGADAFYNCSALKKAVIPDSVTTIGETAFGMHNSALTFYTRAGSAAQEYADENGIALVMPVEYIELTPLFMEADPGSTFHISYDIYPESASGTVTWSSSDTSVAAVDSHGTVTVSASARPGDEAVITAAIGDKSGTCKVYVMEIDLSGADVTAPAQTYTGAALKPAPTVKLNGKTLVKDTDYTVSYKNNVNAGYATVTVTGKGDYAGTASGTFKIDYASLASAAVTLSPTSFTYDGTAKKPEVTVKLGTKTLTNGMDYLLGYKDNVNAGTATVTVTGMGNYTGAVKKTFTIKAASSGAPSGWQKESGKWYYYRDGAPVTGWQKLSGKWYYFDANGAMQTGWQKLSGKWYYFNANGAMQTGWQKLSGKWYYFNANGVMQTGWQKLSGKWYYFDANGAMQTGWQKLSGKWYYFDGNGAMLTGWQKLSGKWYYFDANGAMLTGTQTIGGKTYTFDSNGVWIS